MGQAAAMLVLEKIHIRLNLLNLLVKILLNLSCGGLWTVLRMILLNLGRGGVWGALGMDLLNLRRLVMAAAAAAVWETTCCWGL